MSANPAPSPPPTPGTPPDSPSTTATTADGWSTNRRAPRPSRSPPPWPEPNPKPSPRWTTPTGIEADLRAEQDAHRAHLRGRPPDVSDRIANADATVRARQRDLADWEQRLGHWQDQQAATAGLRGLTRSRRHQHHQAASHIDTMTPNLERARHDLDQAVHRARPVHAPSKPGANSSTSPTSGGSSASNNSTSSSPSTGPTRSSTPPGTATPPPTAPSACKPPEPTWPHEHPRRAKLRRPRPAEICSYSITPSTTSSNSEPGISPLGPGHRSTRASTTNPSTPPTWATRHLPPPGRTVGM